MFLVAFMVIISLLWWILLILFFLVSTFREFVSLIFYLSLFSTRSTEHMGIALILSYRVILYIGPV